MRMKGMERSERRQEETRNLAKQFLSEYDIVVPRTFPPHTDGRRRQT
jgi:thymidylate synthase ThyX